MSNGQVERHSMVAQIEHLHMKYSGTGYANTSKWEWGTNIQRDTIASHIGHMPRMMYFATVENESNVRMKTRMLNSLAQPCGPPPPNK